MEDEASWDQKAKRSTVNEADVVNWIESITGNVKGEESVGEWLKSGVVLCNLVNTIRPGLIRSVNQQALPFKQMENIKNFLTAARELGMLESAGFDTNDLFEQKNIDVVLACLYAVGGAVQTSCPEFAGTKLGTPVIPKGKDGKRLAPKPAANLLHLDPAQVAVVRQDAEQLKGRVAELEESKTRLAQENDILRKRCDVDIPHWIKELHTIGTRLEAAIEPIAKVPLGVKLQDVLGGLKAIEVGLKGIRAAPIREELDELKRAFAAHMSDALLREDALRQELARLQASSHTNGDCTANPASSASSASAASADLS